MAKKVYYSLEEGTKLAAKQNFDRDVSVQLEKARDWEKLREEYEEEAQHLLEQTGENYIPDSAFQDHICLEGFVQK